MAKLKNARILIIGSSSGIGLGVAKAAIADGASVMIASSDVKKMQAAAARLGEADTAHLDVTDERAVQNYFASSGSFDHIVFTAGDWGVARRACLADIDLASAAALFRVRFWGAMAVAKHGAKSLLPNGSFTLTGGMSAHKPEQGSVAATAMAGAVEHLVLGLAVELAPMRVNAVCPGRSIPKSGTSSPNICVRRK